MCLGGLATCKVATITTRRLPPIHNYFCNAIIFALQLSLHCNYFCIAFFFALELCLQCNRFCTVPGTLCLKLQSLRDRGDRLGVCLGGLAACRVATITTPDHRLTIIFSLQLFLHCNYFCIAIIVALQLFLHCNYFCIAIAFVLSQGLFVLSFNFLGFAGIGRACV